MIIRKAFKFRLNTNPEIEQKLLEFSGCCRFVWNKVLSLNLYRLENNMPIMWKGELSFWLTLWKKSDEYSFLKDCHSQPLQQTIDQLERAFKDCFDKNQPNKRLPRFKKKGKSDSFRYPQGFKIDQESSTIFLPKIGIVKYRNSRRIVGAPKNVTVSRKGGHWYVSIQTEYETAHDPIHPSASGVGIDMGVIQFATLSDGTVYAPLNSFKGLAAKLANLQKQLKNKKKFSNNWKKLQAKIVKLHERIASARQDYLHKISTEISENQALVVIEDLRVSNMTKRAKNKNVVQKSGLNRSILDQGWSMFATMLEYKQAWSGGQVLRVPAAYTSQTCPCCGHVSKENRTTQASFVCVDCGYKNNADVVGAINVMARGHRVLACQASDAVMSPATGTSKKLRSKLTL
ncbi:RNA-guided endonuclease InsQ/TnpB family protein [Crenothrix polyspora]|uniref:Putative transposase n=1 Tax=Crenothrix polyspora TaxID=360316 RepID=A0A1R4H3W0_9GAMM|nr:RNA-guided endonuclease TnpB family protein [Crenothrix polyspora]SJM90866.1 putative transposase [Crenothrix polyspora]